MAEFIKNSPFRFWCQKVLPLVYDDSLSYYELLCKVVGKLNEMAENQNNLSDEIKEVAKDLDDFKEQVPGMVEAKVEEWLNNYITTHGLVNSVNGMTGEVTLTAADVGAIANVNGSVKNNNIAGGAVTTEKIADGAVTGDKIAGKAITANKLADGVIPEKLPNPQKLTFTGAVTGEYDGSQAVNIDIPAGGGGGGGGAVDSVNGMTGAVVLKKLTAGEGLSMSGEDGYNGSAEQSVGIAPGGVSSDKVADNAITEQKIANGAVTANKIAEGVIPTVSSFRKTLKGNSVKLYIYITRVNDIYTVYAEAGTTKSGSITPEELNIDYPFEGETRKGYVILNNISTGAIGGNCIFTLSEGGCNVIVSSTSGGFGASMPYIGTGLLGYRS